MANTVPLFSTDLVVGPSSASRVSCGIRDASMQSGAFFKPLNGLIVGSSLSGSLGRWQVLLSRRSGAKHASSHRRGSIISMAVSTDTVPPLNDLPLLLYINQNGRIQPPVESDTKASVFVVFDKAKKAQYIGFSRDVRNSLRTLMGRRPDVCHYFKIYNLTSLDQKKMLACRQQWVTEMGLPPAGNGDPAQKQLWEQPVNSGSISERGKLAAASSMARQLLQSMADRGLKEEMVYNPELLAQGKCDVLLSENQTADELEKAAKLLAEEAAKRRTAVVTSPNGVKVEFEVFFERKTVTNGGWMYDILVTKDDKETRHRIICGRMYPESVNLPEDRFVEMIIGFLLFKKVPRRTEGLMGGGDFPINYFAVSEVFQEYDDAQEWFAGMGELPDCYWRFNRVHDYGPSKLTPYNIGPGPARRQPVEESEQSPLISSTPL